jgi:hypothetical protein
MALLRRKSEGAKRADTTSDRAGTSPGLVRAIATLIGVAAAGLLIWIAHAVAGPLDEASTSEFWLAMALIAGAGLALGLSQLLGGWTKWGWPTLSPTVFLLGFIPTLIVGGWIALAKQPQQGVQEGRFDGWSGDLGIGGFVDDIGTYLPVIPLIVGLVLAFSFDTTGPRTRITTRETTVPDEDVHDYRTEAPATTTATTGSGTTVAEEIRNRDTRTQPVGAGATRVDRTDDDDTRRTT